MNSIILIAFVGLINYCIVGGDFVQKGDQYCELFWGNETLYAVMGNYSSCTKSPGFYDLEVEDIQAVHGEEAASEVAWNGIREWLVDGFRPQKGYELVEDRTPYSYGNMFPDGSGFEMVQIAEIDFSSFTQPSDFVTVASFTNQFYVDTYSERFLTAVYKTNETVYELVSKDCSSIYVMQSYYIGRPGEFSGLSDPSQLQNLGKRLNLPSGWTYRTRVLENDLKIYGVNGTTTVMQDDMRNSYSAMDQPFDKALCFIESPASIE